MTNSGQHSIDTVSTLALTLALALAVMIAVCFFSLGRIGKQKETDLQKVVGFLVFILFVGRLTMHVSHFKICGGFVSCADHFVIC